MEFPLKSSWVRISLLLAVLFILSTPSFQHPLAPAGSSSSVEIERVSISAVNRRGGGGSRGGGGRSRGGSGKGRGVGGGGRVIPMYAGGAAAAGANGHHRNGVCGRKPNLEHILLAPAAMLFFALLFANFAC